MKEIKEVSNVHIGKESKGNIACFVDFILENDEECRMTSYYKQTQTRKKGEVFGIVQYLDTNQKMKEEEIKHYMHFLLTEHPKVRTKAILHGVLI